MILCASATNCTKHKNHLDIHPVPMVYYHIPDIHAYQQIKYTDSLAYSNQPEQAYIAFSHIDTLYLSSLQKQYIALRQYELLHKYQLYYLDTNFTLPLDAPIDDPVIQYLYHTSHKYNDYNHLSIDTISKYQDLFEKTYGLDHHLTRHAQLTELEYFTFTQNQLVSAQQLYSKIEEILDNQATQTLDHYWLYDIGFYAHFYNGKHSLAYSLLQTSQNLKTPCFTTDHYLSTVRDINRSLAQNYVETDTKHEISFQHLVEKLEKKKYPKLHQILLSKQIIFDEASFNTHQSQAYRDTINKLIQSHDRKYININRHHAIHHYLEGNIDSTIIYGLTALKHKGSHTKTANMYRGSLHYVLQDCYSKKGDTQRALYHLAHYLYNPDIPPNNTNTKRLLSEVDEKLIKKNLDFIIQGSKIYLNNYYKSNNLKDLHEANKLAKIGVARAHIWYDAIDEEELLELYQFKRQIAKEVLLSSDYLLYQNKKSNIIDSLLIDIELTQGDILYRDKQIISESVKDTSLRQYQRDRILLTFAKKSNEEQLSEHVASLKNKKENAFKYYSFAKRKSEAIKKLPALKSYLTDHNSLLVLITRLNNHYLKYTYHGGKAAIDTFSIAPSLLEDFYKACATPKTKMKEYLNSAGQIQNALNTKEWADYDNVFIVGDGHFKYFPFEAFYANQDTKEINSYEDIKYLNNETNIIHAHSIFSCLEYHDTKNYLQQKGDSIRALALSFTDIHEPPNPTIPNLMGAYNEIKKLENLYPNSICKYGSLASKNYFLSQMDKPYDLMHLALHANSSSDKKFNNYLLFNSGQGTDTLFGFELQAYALRSPMVHLSACHTAFGESHLSEGRYSLLRYFALIGAKIIIANRWEAIDQSIDLPAPYFKCNEMITAG